jgi:hypothetical protein
VAGGTPICTSVRRTDRWDCSTTSFLVSPIPDHTFFEQTVLQCQLGDNLLERNSFLA